MIYISFEERTGWRDTDRISQRHRMYGVSVPCCDLDFPLMEYTKAQTVALIEYKHEFANKVERNNPSIRALTDLGNKANIPVYVARYKDDFSSYDVMALNDLGVKKLGHTSLVLTENDYVRFLHYLRGNTTPDDVIENLKREV